MTAIEQLIAGDDWEFDVTLLKDDETPYDLTSATITWILLDRSGIGILSTPDVTITVTDAIAGKALIKVPAAKTAPLVGSYNQNLRVVIAGVTATPLIMPLDVLADPFKSLAVAPARRRLGVVP